MNETKKDISEAKSDSVSIKVSFFNGKGHHAFIHQKSHKLASAVYLITDLIKDTEPLKWKMRENSLTLISHNLALASSISDSKKTLLDKISASCLEMVSLIEIARTAQIISSMNFTILRKEFLDLLSFMESKDLDSLGGNKHILGEEFFKVESSPVSLVSNEMSYKGQNSVFDNMSFIKRPNEEIYSRPPHNVLNSNSKSFVMRVKEPGLNIGTKSKPFIKDKKDDRRGAIISVVKKMKEVTINDISSVVSGCSEKTIQRELLALVSDGVLKKVGERRWSKYSIK